MNASAVFTSQSIAPAPSLQPPHLPQAAGGQPSGFMSILTKQSKASTQAPLETAAGKPGSVEAAILAMIDDTQSPSSDADNSDDPALLAMAYQLQPAPGQPLAPEAGSTQPADAPPPQVQVDEAGQKATAPTPTGATKQTDAPMTERAPQAGGQVDHLNQDSQLAAQSQGAFIQASISPSTQSPTAAPLQKGGEPVGKEGAATPQRYGNQPSGLQNFIKAADTLGEPVQMPDNLTSVQISDQGSRKEMTPEEMLKDLALLRDEKTEKTPDHMSATQHEFNLQPLHSTPDHGIDATTKSSETTDLKATHASIMTQVKEAVVEHLQNGESKITLRLHPEELGNLQIEISAKGSSVKVNVVAEHANVKTALLENAETLRDVLGRQNLKMESFNVATGQGQDHQRNRQQQTDDIDMEAVLKKLSRDTHNESADTKDTRRPANHDGLLNVIA